MAGDGFRLNSISAATASPRQTFNSIRCRRMSSNRFASKRSFCAARLGFRLHLLECTDAGSTEQPQSIIPLEVDYG